MPRGRPKKAVAAPRGVTVPAHMFSFMLGALAGPERSMLRTLPLRMSSILDQKRVARGMTSGINYNQWSRRKSYNDPAGKL